MVAVVDTLWADLVTMRQVNQKSSDSTLSPIRVENNNHESMDLPVSSEERQSGLSIPTDCEFYQTMSLPGIGLVNGAWDHREAIDAFLGHINFEGKRVLDVGPANGFFSFEMERRGAKVTALDLGQEAAWDAVPRLDLKAASSDETLRDNVRRVENAFWFARQILNSEVQLVHGSVYDVPKLIERVDVALMGNILQHLRDPFRAVEQVARVVDEAIIIAETLWVEDKGFLNAPMMHFIPSITAPEANHSWWQVSPVLVIEILKLLGFRHIKYRLHNQWFNGTPAEKEMRMPRRLVPHFTVTGTRANYTPIVFAAGWYEEEHDEECAWRWAYQKRTSILIKNPELSPSRGDLSLELASVRHGDVIAYFNGSVVWEGGLTPIPKTIELQGLDLNPGENFLEIISDSEPARNENDSRPIGMRLYNFPYLVQTYKPSFFTA